jgi:hypothetical protein
MTGGGVNPHRLSDTRALEQDIRRHKRRKIHLNMAKPPVRRSPQDESQTQPATTGGRPVRQAASSQRPPLGQWCGPRRWDRCLGGAKKCFCAGTVTRVGRRRSGACVCSAAAARTPTAAASATTGAGDRRAGGPPPFTRVCGSYGCEEIENPTSAQHVCGTAVASAVGPRATD